MEYKIASKRISSRYITRLLMMIQQSSTIIRDALQYKSDWNSSSDAFITQKIMETSASYCNTC